MQETAEMVAWLKQDQPYYQALCILSPLTVLLILLENHTTPQVTV